MYLTERNAEVFRKPLQNEIQRTTRRVSYNFKGHPGSKKNHVQQAENGQRADLSSPQASPYILRYHGIIWYPVRSHEIPWYLTGYQMIPCYLMGYLTPSGLPEAPTTLVETVSGLYRAEVIHGCGSWRSYEAVEYATLESVD